MRIMMYDDDDNDVWFLVMMKPRIHVVDIVVCMYDDTDV